MQPASTTVLTKRYKETVCKTTWYGGNLRVCKHLWQSRGERWQSDLPEAVVTRGKVSVGFSLEKSA